MATPKKGKGYLTYSERMTIWALLKHDTPISQIAKTLGRCDQTIRNELERGKVIKDDKVTYDCDVGQQVQKERSKNRGRPIKITKEEKEVITQLILDENSPYVALAIGQEEGLLKNTYSVQTIYNYAHKHILNIESSDLICGFYKTKKKKEDFDKRRESKKPKGGKPITCRSKDVLNRKEFGHWEGDTVCGKQGTQGVFLTLIERKTRYLISVPLPNRKQQTIASAIDSLEQFYGNETFNKLFKTLTFDNGIEFCNTPLLQKSIFSDSERLEDIYYAHPYCSSERGSNEVIHKMIRRKYPKGISLDNVDKQEYANWISRINKYPRKLFDKACSKFMFDKELAAL